MWGDFFGVFCSLLSSVLVAMGVSLQKVFKLRRTELSTLSNRPVVMQLGVIFVVTGMALRFPVYLYLPLTTISILSSLTASLSTLFDKRLIREQAMSQSTFASALLTGIGSLLIILVAELHSEGNGVVQRFFARLFALEGFSIAVFVAVLFIGYFQCQERFALWTDYSLYVCSALAALWASLFSLFLKLTCIAWASHARHSSFSPSQWSTTILLTVATIACLWLKIRSVKSSLQSFDARVFMPSYQVATILLSIALGVVYLQELHSLGKTAWLAALTATAIVCTGILLQGAEELQDYEELQSEDNAGEPILSIYVLFLGSQVSLITVVLLKLVATLTSGHEFEHDNLLSAEV